MYCMCQCEALSLHAELQLLVERDDTATRLPAGSAGSGKRGGIDDVGKGLPSTDAEAAFPADNPPEKRYELEAGPQRCTKLSSVPPVSCCMTARYCQHDCLLTYTAGKTLA